MSGPERLEPIPEAHYAAIGKVAAAWALFELMIDGYIAQITGIHEQTSVCLTAQIAGHGRKLDALISLVRLGNPSNGVDQEMKKIAKDAGRLAEIRNRIVHDVWAGHLLPTGVIPKRLEMTAKKILRLTLTEMSTIEVLKVLNDIQALQGRLIAAIERFEAERRT